MSDTPPFARSPIDFTDKDKVKVVLKDLSNDEFLRLMEGSSPEELQLLLQTAESQYPAGKTFHFGGSQSLLQLVPRQFQGLFSVSRYQGRTAMDVIRWWESRRLAYNAILAVIGVFSMVLFHALGFAPFHSLVLPAIAYGIMANICYTAGWMAEIYARLFFGEKTENFGPSLFLLGLTFSMLLTALPSVLAVIAFVLNRLVG
ncbi:hypothetical protein KF728_10920 [Candidatus Obscuribacterales bacterium]|nr:hypothetical protein [Candidatus Obscuribacterales bacterium]MBX3150650.1 hypothetical protein [Candidatus Obscuribacterales bacterium]